MCFELHACDKASGTSLAPCAVRIFTWVQHAFQRVEHSRARVHSVLFAVIIAGARVKRASLHGAGLARLEQVTALVAAPGMVDEQGARAANLLAASGCGPGQPRYEAWPANWATPLLTSKRLCLCLHHGHLACRSSFQTTLPKPSTASCWSVPALAEVKAHWSAPARQSQRECKGAACVFAGRAARPVFGGKALPCGWRAGW